MVWRVRLCGGRTGSGQKKGSLHWVLPIVVYNGSKPWIALGRSSDLVPPPWTGMKRASAMMQPQNYALLSAGTTLTAEGRLVGNWPLGKRGCIERLAC